MSKRQTVWFVERGQYSDYGVFGVYSTEENANYIADKLNSAAAWGKATVREVELDRDVAGLRAGLMVFRVVMAADGTVESVTTEPYADCYGTSMDVWPRTKAPAYKGKPGVQDAVNATVLAKDRKHAVKIVNDKRLQFLASGEMSAP